MHTAVGRVHVIDASLVRWAARISAAVLVAAWLVFVFNEAVRSRFDMPADGALYQGVALAIVFAGYAIGWWREFAGGLTAIVGIVAFYAVHLVVFSMLPQLPILWFAAPGVLYLLAWHSEQLSGSPLARQR